MLVIGLFAYLVYRGFRVALQARTTTSATYLAMGIVCWIAFQALINIGGITRSIPLTGIPLPFVSYGGSSLIMVMAGVGVLLSVSRYGSESVPEKQAGAIARRRRTRRRAGRCPAGAGDEHEDERGPEDMRIAFCGGGHRRPRLPGAGRRCCPAQARAAEPVELLYIGVQGRMDADIVAREDVPFQSVTAGPLRIGSSCGTAQGRPRARVRHGAVVQHPAQVQARRGVRQRRLRQRRRRPGSARSQGAAAALPARRRSRAGRADPGEGRRPHRRHCPAGAGEAGLREDGAHGLPGARALLRRRQGRSAQAAQASTRSCRPCSSRAPAAAPRD